MARRSAKTPQSRRETSHELARELGRSCLLFRARALSRKLTSLYDDAVRPLGLKSTQVNVMTVIGLREGEARLTTLAQMLSLEPSSLSRIVRVMERNGWVESRPDPEDERARRIRLTDAGVSLYAQAVERWRESQEEARTLLGADGALLFTQLANDTLFPRAPGSV
ncbi:MAG: MarR family transcriptional regulator [Myxococcota bacterium]